MTRQEYKLLFAGPMGAGKTTAIAAISEIPPVTTDVVNTDQTGFAKATTTAALDYGEVTLEGGDKLRLFGTPGQDRFEFMWELLSNGALGVIVLIDNSAKAPLKILKDYLDSFLNFAIASRVVVGIGRMDASKPPRLKDYQEALDEMGLRLPVLSIDVRKREDVLLALNVLFHQIQVASLSRDNTPELRRQHESTQ